MINDEEFLEQFESGAWPLEQWHHRQHIKTAYLYLRKYPFETAMQQIRERIKSYNAVHKIPDLPTRGYHETMTQAWMRLVHLTLWRIWPGGYVRQFLRTESPVIREENAETVLFT